MSHRDISWADKHIENLSVPQERMVIIEANALKIPIEHFSDRILFLCLL